MFRFRKIKGKTQRRVGSLKFLLSFSLTRDAITVLSQLFYSINCYIGFCGNMSAGMFGKYVRLFLHVNIWKFEH